MVHRAARVGSAVRTKKPELDPPCGPKKLRFSLRTARQWSARRTLRLLGSRIGIMPAGLDGDPGLKVHSEPASAYAIHGR